MRSEGAEAVVRSLALSLQAQGLTLSVAESCTGGRIASLLTSQGGASEWFCGGVVAYTRETKMRLLQIDPEELQGGLVTERCAKAMARGVMQLSGSDIALSTTGVCGPSGSEGYAPCYAWIALRRGQQEVALLVEAEDGGRMANIDFVGTEALRALLGMVNGEEGQ